jgi:3-dehydroquinate synthase
VHIDVHTLRTLPPREFAAGMAEVIKYGVIRDRPFFTWLVGAKEQLRRLEAAELVGAVKRSCQIKANIVEIDERENSLRAVLNFGHTFGHAVETLAGYGRFRHGEAVAIGMVVAATAASELGLCSREEAATIGDLLAAFDLPVTPPDFPLSDYLQAMGRDKKVQQGTLRLVLNCGIGDCTIRQIAEPEALFRSVLDRLSATRR